MGQVASKYVTANLKLLTTKEGGRLSGIASGYRPNHVFEYSDGQVLSTYIGEIEFDDSTWIQPGEIRKVTIRFLFVPEIEKYLIVGNKWWIHEGGRLIGEGEILEVLS